MGCIVITKRRDDAHQKTRGGTHVFWVRTVVSLSVRGSPSCQPHTTMSQIITCDDCESIVELGRDTTGRLVMRCDCPSTRHVRVSKALPNGWTA